MSIIQTTSVQGRLGLVVGATENLDLWLQQHDYLDDSGEFNVSINDLPGAMIRLRDLREACRGLADRCERLIEQRMESIIEG